MSRELDIVRRIESGEFHAELALFHTPAGIAFADVWIDGVRETWPIDSKGFEVGLQYLAYTRLGRTLKPGELRDARTRLEAVALREGVQRQVFTRVANFDGAIYIHLGNNRGEVVEIKAGAWRVVQNPDVRFCRSQSMLPLPHPEKGGALETLSRFLNVNAASLTLILGWLLSVLRLEHEHAILVLTGVEGSLKTTCLRILISLTDPRSGVVGALPRTEKELIRQAGEHHVLAFDNVSNVSSTILDALCRLSSAGKSIIMTGVEPLVKRADFADRCILLTFDPIADESRRRAEDVWAEFEASKPLILGALYDAAGAGLSALLEGSTGALTRMADFENWATCCHLAFPQLPNFSSAFRENRAQTTQKLIEADDVLLTAQALVERFRALAGDRGDPLPVTPPTGHDRT